MMNRFFGPIRIFFSEIPKGIHTHRKGILFLAILVAGISLFLGTAAYNISNLPGFCSSCHNMDPYVESWKASSHSHVSCVTCHYEPGFFNHLLGKYRDGQVSFVYFITGKTPPKYHAEISDRSCLQGGCHTKAELPDDEVFKTVRFSHSLHLKDLRRGKKIRCTTCHAQIVQGDHLKVDTDDCFICHFKTEIVDGKKKSSEISECTICHKEPPEEIPMGDHVFAHGRYVRNGIECQSCHTDIIKGDGDVIPGKCVECHNEPDMTESKYSSEALHLNHVTNHKIECYRCHQRIQHQVLRNPTIEHFDASCSSCHEDRLHLGTQEMYRGEGGMGVPDSPSAMYLANVDCLSCHNQTSNPADAFYKDENRHVDFGMDVSCNHCHGEGYDAMIGHWRKLLNQSEHEIMDKLLDAENRVFAQRNTPNNGSLKDVKILLKKARHNLTFVSNANGLHNITYALKLLEKTAEWTDEALTLLDSSHKSGTFTRVAFNCTSLCHFGQETRTVPFRSGMEFPHEPHVVDNGFDCTTCHGEGTDHGKTVFQACNECHHGSGEGSVECAHCHTNVTEIFNGRGGYGVDAMPSVKADSMECVSCHSEVEAGETTTLTGIQGQCVECHEDDSQQYRRMVVDWKKAANGYREKLREHQQRVLDAIEHAERNKINVVLARNQLIYAQRNMAILGDQNGLHNIEYAEKLAEAAHLFLDEALRELDRLE